MNNTELPSVNSLIVVDPIIDEAKISLNEIEETTKRISGIVNSGNEAKMRTVLRRRDDRLARLSKYKFIAIVSAICCVAILSLFMYFDYRVSSHISLLENQVSYLIKLTQSTSHN